MPKNSEIDDININEKEAEILLFLAEVAGSCNTGIEEAQRQFREFSKFLKNDDARLIAQELLTIKKSGKPNNSKYGRHASNLIDTVYKILDVLGVDKNKLHKK